MPVTTAWILDVVPQVEGPFVLDQRGIERERPDRRLGGAERRLERAVVLAGGGPVVRELGPVARLGGAADGRSRLERLGEGPMQLAPLAGQQLVVHDLLDERVAERVALHAGAGLDDQQVAADRGAEPVVQLVLGQAGDLGEQLVLDPPAGHRGHAQDRRRVSGTAAMWASRISRSVGGRRGPRGPGGSRPAAPRRRTGCRRTGCRLRHELVVGLRAEDRR